MKKQAGSSFPHPRRPAFCPLSPGLPGWGFSFTTWGQQATRLQSFRTVLGRILRIESRWSARRRSVRVTIRPAGPYFFLDCGNPLS